MANEYKTLLILEKSNENLHVAKKTDNEYILEGIFAEFGVENNNNRIYEEEEYLPHLEYLQKKIQENRLMGELDHPDKFEISLDKVSHLIEKLEYDKENRRIIGRVRLLDTPAGKIAKSLVDAGVPISISSRAAGTVDRNNKVKIQRIFTYDLVADPGFENAKLKRINESFGFSPNSNVQIFDASEWEIPEIKNNKTKKIVEEQDNTQYVTVDALQRYSLMLKREISRLHERLDEKSNYYELQKKVDQLVEHIKNLRKEIDDRFSVNEDNIKNLIDYTQDELAKNLDRVIEYVDYLSDNINMHIDYVNETISPGISGQKQLLDAHIDYVNEEIAKKLDYVLQNNETLNEHVSNLIDYVNEELVENIENIIDYNNYLAKETQMTREYSEYIAENAAVREDLQNLIEYTEYGFRTLSGEEVDEDLNESEKFAAPENSLINESLKNINNKDVKNRVDKISESIDTLLEQIKKEKSDFVEKYPFFNLLDEQNKQIFESLSETQKEKVREKMSQIKTIDKKALNESFITALQPEPVAENKEPLWLAKAPEKYRKIYESLSPDKKQKIHAAAEWYAGKLETDYQILNFWQTRGLDETDPAILNADNVLNENQNPEIKQPGVQNIHLGYSPEKIKMISESLKRFRDI